MDIIPLVVLGLDSLSSSVILLSAKLGLIQFFKSYRFSVIFGFSPLCLKKTTIGKIENWPLLKYILQSHLYLIQHLIGICQTKTLYFVLV